MTKFGKTAHNVLFIILRYQSMFGKKFIFGETSLLLHSDSMITYLSYDTQIARKPSYLAGYESPLSCQLAQFSMGMTQNYSIFTSCYVPLTKKNLTTMKNILLQHIISCNDKIANKFKGKKEHNMIMHRKYKFADNSEISLL